MPNKRSRQQAQKNARPAKITGLTHMQSEDTRAFMDAYGRLGGRHEKRPNRAAAKREWKAEL
jgi:hypothetical protein